METQENSGHKTTLETPNVDKSQNEEIVENNFGAGHNKEDELTLARACEAAKDEIEVIEAEQAKIDEIMEKAKQQCASFRDTISTVKKKIKDDYSIETKALGTILAMRRQDRRMTARINALEGVAADQFEQFEMLFAE